jgi:hypothetical protein
LPNKHKAAVSARVLVQIQHSVGTCSVPTRCGRADGSCGQACSICRSCPGQLNMLLLSYLS